MHDDCKNIEIFKALSDKHRLEILRLLRDGEKCACKLLDHLDIEQSTLSHHMKILTSSGLVNVRKVGKWMHYSINQESCLNVCKLMKQLTSVKTNKEIKNEVS